MRKPRETVARGWVGESWQPQTQPAPGAIRCLPVDVDRTQPRPNPNRGRSNFVGRIPLTDSRNPFDREPPGRSKRLRALPQRRSRATGRRLSNFHPGAVRLPNVRQAESHQPPRVQSPGACNARWCIASDRTRPKPSGVRKGGKANVQQSFSSSVFPSHSE